MALEIVCDVEGCNERSLVGSRVGGAPPGWTLVVLFPPEEPDGSIRRRNMAASVANKYLAGLQSSNLNVVKRAICPKHVLPSFKEVEDDESDLPFSPFPGAL